MKQVAIYVRVSTGMQSPQLQLRDLRKFAKSSRWRIFREYVDRGESGTSSSHPELNQLMDDARKGKFEGVLVWRFDRFARSLKHLVNTLAEFEDRGVGFVSYQENLDLSTSMGKAMFGIIGAMAQMERDIIAERVKAGLETARAQGKKLGRPRVDVDVDRIMRLSEKSSVREIAKKTGYSPSTVWRVIRRNSSSLQKQKQMASNNPIRR